uniref:Uncharacterized protein n=1 Tax=Schistosoma japonicum TaxID=6182 RepID=Q5BYA1_SCHJA|nr:unknown [Schistosoma japonicum]
MYSFLVLNSFDFQLLLSHDHTLRNVSVLIHTEC